MAPPATSTGEIMSFKYLLPGQTYEFVYTNHRGETAKRLVIFQGLDYGSNDWHPTPCWLLRGKDLERQASRSFDLAKIDTDSLREFDVAAYFAGLAAPTDLVLKQVGQALEELHPFGYRSEDKEP
jgi:hypothetical protein